MLYYRHCAQGFFLDVTYGLLPLDSLSLVACERELDGSVPVWLQFRRYLPVPLPHAWRKASHGGKIRSHEVEVSKARSRKAKQQLCPLHMLVVSIGRFDYNLSYRLTLWPAGLPPALWTLPVNALF